MTWQNSERLLVMTAVELAVMKIDSSALDKVISKLKTQHNYKIEDCIDCPQNIKAVLCELFADDFDEIVKSIREILEKGLVDKKIAEFLNVLEHKSNNNR